MNSATAQPRVATHNRTIGNTPDEGSLVLHSSMLGLEIRLLRNGKYQARKLNAPHQSNDYPTATTAVIGGLMLVHENAKPFSENSPPR